MMKFQKIPGALALVLMALGCEQGDEVSQLKPIDDLPLFMDLPAEASGRRSTDSKYAVLMAEYLASDESGQVGRTIFFKDVGNKQLTEDFVAGLSLDGTD